VKIVDDAQGDFPLLFLSDAQGDADVSGSEIPELGTFGRRTFFS
jgi:hypothetical protein